MKRYYALFSGGVDSSLALLKVTMQETDTTITPLFFNYGQKAAEKEEEAVTNIIPWLREYAQPRNVIIEDYRKYEIGGTDLFSWSESPILKGREISDDPDVENRNMILISAAISVIMSDRKREGTRSKKRRLIVGFRNEHYDTTRKFALGLNQVLRPRDFSVEIVTPLVKDYSKVGWHSLAKQIHSKEGAEALLSLAWSCYYPTPDGLPCGACGPCISRSKLDPEVRTRIRMKSQQR